MITSLLNVMFGCSHKNTTFPITPSRRSQLTKSVRSGTYVACLDCGKEFDYNWREMRMGDAVGAPAASARQTSLHIAH